MEEIAVRSSNPIESLIAFELGAFGVISDERYRALDVIDELASRLDDDLVSRRLLPLRSKLAPNVTLAKANRNLVPGQRAPKFTLPDIEGVEFSLQETLDSSDFVLVEFWASWCAPCIRKFPDLKKLYESYHEMGLQVITINTDESIEDWARTSEEQQFPWIDLGELEGTEDSPVATSYGVLRLPTGYVVDKNGCVIQKELRIDMLTEFLVERYGEVSKPGNMEKSDPESS